MEKEEKLAEVTVFYKSRRNKAHVTRHRGKRSGEKVHR